MILTLRAWSRLPVRLPAGLAAEVKQSSLVDVRLIAAPDRWELVSDSSVGVVVGSDWELRVEPKIEIPQLLFLVAYAHSQDGWRDLMAGFGRESQLLDAVASGFAVHCERAIESGLLRGYVHYEESRPDLRGRIRFADQIARNPGLPLPLEVSYDDFTADVHENRLLRTALEVLLRLPRIPSRARIRLLGVRAALGDVAILRDRRDFAAPPITRLNKRYESALVLAELILRHSSVTASSGEVLSATFVFDMNRVFEDFVGTTLTEAFRPIGGAIRLQHPDRLDDDSAVALPIRPDITWWRRTWCLAVIDAKYKLDREPHDAECRRLPDACVLHRAGSPSRRSRLREGQWRATTATHDPPFWTRNRRLRTRRRAPAEGPAPPGRRARDGYRPPRWRRRRASLRAKGRALPLRSSLQSPTRAYETPRRCGS